MNSESIRAFLGLFAEDQGSADHRLQVEHSPSGNREILRDNSSINFELRRAVLSGLAHFATRQSLEVIVAILEQEHAVDLQRLAEDTGSLRSALTKMFGSGQSIVEGRISQALAREVGIEYDGRSLDEMILLLKEANATKALDTPH